MNAHYIARQGQAQHQEDNFTATENYRVNFFILL